MARFVVQGVLREGHNGSFRVGRRWPSNQQTEIEILDQDDDPKPGDKPAHAQEAAEKKGIPVFGKKSFELLRGDPFLKVLQAGDPLAIAKAAADVPALQAEIERLTDENRVLKERLAVPTAAASGSDSGEHKEGREPPRRR